MDMRSDIVIFLSKRYRSLLSVYNIWEAVFVTDMVSDGSMLYLMQVWEVVGICYVCSRCVK